jgi:hypothetical protein
MEGHAAKRVLFLFGCSRTVSLLSPFRILKSGWILMDEINHSLGSIGVFAQMSVCKSKF